MNKNLIAALAEIHNLPHDSQGYGYDYTSLPKVLDHVRDVLAKHNLAVIQHVTNVENGDPAVITYILGEEGIVVEAPPISCSTKGLNMKSEAQSTGAVITYLRRYALASLVGIASDADNDAAPAKPTAKQLATIKEKMHEWHKTAPQEAKSFYRRIGLPATSDSFTADDAAKCLAKLRESKK
jgi:hypothetical protein